MYEERRREARHDARALPRGGEGEQIRWSIVDTALGQALVAATERGICMVELGEDAARARSATAREFPKATLQRVDAGRDEFLAPRVRAVADALAGKAAQVDVDLIGTAFQKKVWDALMKIPRGETRSYAPLAGELGAAARRTRGRQRLRAQPHRGRRAVPSRRARRRLARRLSLGPAAQAGHPRSANARRDPAVSTPYFFRRAGGRVGRCRPSLIGSNTMRVS